MLSVSGSQPYAKQYFNDDYSWPYVDQLWNWNETGHAGDHPEVVVDPDHTESGCMGWPTNRDQGSWCDDSDGTQPTQHNHLLVSHTGCMETNWGPAMTHIWSTRVLSWYSNLTTLDPVLGLELRLPKCCVCPESVKP